MVSVTRKIPRSELLDELQRLADVVGDTPRLCDLKEHGHFSKQPYEREFGGWTRAVKEAGLTPNVSYGVSEEEALDEIRRLANELSRRPTYDDVIEYSTYSHKVYEKHFEGWNPALEAAGFETWSPPSGEDHPSWNGGLVAVECSRDSCSQTQLTPRSRVDRVRFCSRECKDRYQEEAGIVSGRNNPSWKGGASFDYGPNWEEQREAARERDGYECQGCGLAEEDHWRELSVHHKIRLGAFLEDGKLDWERANALSNLVTLCQSCHRDWEKMSPLCPVVD